MPKECAYPACNACSYADCVMDANELHAMLKRRRWQSNPELYRQRQRDYRSRIKENLPHCDECVECLLVRKEKEDGYRRLCKTEMRLIEQKVSNSPNWCPKRKGNNGGNR